MRSLKTLALGLLITASGIVSGETRLVLQSEAGDYIGQGRTYTFTDANASFKYTKNPDNGISLTITTPQEYWSLDLAAPGDTTIKAGSYTGAMRFPFQNIKKPGLELSGAGRGCNVVTGRFDVFEVKYGSDGVVSRINATFEQHCEGKTPALRGQLSYNLVRPLGIVSSGATIKSYACLNRTSGQRLAMKSSSALIDCKKAGLQVNVGDDVAITVNGIAE